MIGLFLIYFIGKAFYELAYDNDKSKWGFAILGIVSYYAGAYTGAFLIGIISLLAGSNFAETQPNIVISLLCMPFGILFCWIFYKILASKWSKKDVPGDHDSLDGNVIDKL